MAAGGAPRCGGPRLGRDTSARRGASRRECHRRTVRGSQGAPPGTDRIADAGPPARNVALGQRPDFSPEGGVGPCGPGSVRCSWNRSSARDLGIPCRSGGAPCECRHSRCRGRPAPSAGIRRLHHLALHRPDRLSGRCDPGRAHPHVCGRRAAESSPRGGTGRDRVRRNHSVSPRSLCPPASGISAVLRRGAWTRDVKAYRSEVSRRGSLQRDAGDAEGCGGGGCWSHAGNDAVRGVSFRESFSRGFARDARGHTTRKCCDSRSVVLDRGVLDFTVACPFPRRRDRPSAPVIGVGRPPVCLTFLGLRLGGGRRSDWQSHGRPRWRDRNALPW